MSSAYSKISKFKQKFVEIFDKEAKTSDSPEFLQRLKQIADSQAKIEHYASNVKIFVEASAAQVQMHRQMAEAMFTLYNGSAYESQVLQVMTELSRTQDQVNRMQRIKDNLLKVAQNVVGHITNLQEIVEQRENERVYYDHYRTKLTKMEKSGGESTSVDPEAQEKYARNQSKFDQTKSKFELLSTQLNEEILKVESRIERVTVDLTFKFSKEVQLAFYREMNQVFFKLRDIESEMVETAHTELLKKQEQEKKDSEAEARARRALEDEHGGALDKYSDPKYLAGMGGYGAPAMRANPSSQAQEINSNSQQPSHSQPDYGNQPPQHSYAQQQQYGAQDHQYNQYGGGNNNYDNAQYQQDGSHQQYGANANYYAGGQNDAHQDQQSYGNDQAYGGGYGGHQQYQQDAQNQGYYGHQGNNNYY